jgi:hypothetical protein
VKRVSTNCKRIKQQATFKASSSGDVAHLLIPQVVVICSGDGAHGPLRCKNDDAKTKNDDNMSSGEQRKRIRGNEGVLLWSNG